MLSLDRQEAYRARYRAQRPGWRWSGAVYEAIIRGYVQRDDGTLPTEKRVLDVGCGAGGVIELFSGTVGLPVGIDADLDSLRRHRDPRVRRIWGRLEALPLEAETFDLAISSWTLEHLAAPEAVFHELGRVLKSGGHFVFIAPNVRSLVVRINRLIPRVTRSSLVTLLYGRAEEDTFPALYRANTPARIEALAREAGLERVSLRTVSDPSYLAFNDLFFRLSVLIERVTPPGAYVHIVGDYVKG